MSRRRVGVFVGMVLFFIPAFALAQFVPSLSVGAGVSFGGTVVSVVPCSGGMFHVTIIGARAVPVPEFYIWTPLTETNTYGPPTHPGQQILGLADIPMVCFIGFGFFSSPVPLYGLRMQTVGTSL